MPAVAGSPARWGWASKLTPARWLDETTPEVARALAVRAIADVGICETPWLYGGTQNRSGYIDECLRMAGVPEQMIVAGRGWWCAAVFGRWRRDVGAKAPSGYASCDNWLTWHPDAGKRAWLDAAPTPGAAILYGTASLTGPVIYNGQRYDAHHIGLVIRVMGDQVVTVEGNAAWGGTQTNNGEAVVVRRVSAKQPNIIGYIPATYDGP